MKTIKSIIASTLVLSIFFTQITFAQGHRGHKGENFEQLKTDLNLSEDQVKEIESLKKEFRQQVMTIRTDENLEASQKFEKLQAIKEAQKTAIDGVFTPEQLVKKEALIAERKAEMKAKREEKKAKWEGVDKEGMKAELKAYRDENVKPVMLAQRQKLEADISLADKAEIDQLREIFKAQKEEMKAKKQERMAARKNAIDKSERPTAEQKEAMMEQIKAKKEAMKPHLEAAKALVEKYDATITSLLEEVKPQATSWKEDTRAIKQKYIGDLMEEKAEFGQRGPKRHAHHGKHKASQHGKGDKVNKKKIHFLLMDTEATSSGTQLPAIRNINVYPNPSAARNTIQFEVEKAGTVLIEIHDQSGNVVQRVSQQFLEPGVYREEVNVSQLKESVYYYVISDQSGIISEKFIKLP